MIQTDLNPSEAFRASTIGDSLDVPSRRSKHHHEWFRGTFKEVAKRVPQRFQLEPFQAKDGRAHPRYRTVVAEPSGMPMGIVSEEYELVPHGTLIDAIRQGLQQAGLEASTLPTEVYVGDWGARIGFRTLLPTVTFDPGDGHRLVARVEGFNSVDRTLPLRLALGFYRLVCGNGNAWGIGRTNLLRIHRRFYRTSLDPKAVSQLIVKGLEDAPAAAERLAALYRIPATKQLTQQIGDTVESRWGKKAAERVKTIWAHGRDGKVQVPGAENQTAFGLYQALTWVASRERDLRKQLKMLEEANSAVSFLLN